MDNQSKTRANSAKIFRHLCEQMDNLNAKLITVEDAKAQANLAKQANNILKYELDKAVAICKYENIVINNIEDQE
jgi:hypothetical protein